VAKSPKKSRWNYCNVLQIDGPSRELWAFGAAKGGFALNQQQSLPANVPLPAKIVARDWKGLFQPRLNIAWLPADKIFLRVVQLPVTTFDETLAMAELQLEKISPLPVTQIVWSIHILPRPVDNLQTVIVTIAPRDLVQEFLGQLEGQGYLAHRLEVPLLDQLQATPITGDGAYIYPGSVTGKFTALVAWWYGGVLRNLGLVHVPTVENSSDVLKEQLIQMAWAGEMEGWMTSPPHWYLVANDITSASWQPLFRCWLGQSAEVVSPLSASDLAALTANRTARATAKGNILPPEYAERYQQQFIDGLWIRGLGSILAVYIAGVMIYFAALTFQNYRTDKLEGEVSGLSRSYTNSLQLKARLQVLQDRQALKYASLNLWKITAEQLPADIVIQSLEFKNGRTFSMSGTAPADGASVITDFNEKLRKATLDGQPFFTKIESQGSRLSPGGNSLSWSLIGELVRAEDLQ
jgi:hypothetical protein